MYGGLLLVLHVAVVGFSVARAHNTQSLPGDGDAYQFPCDMTPLQHSEMREAALANLRESGYTWEIGKLQFRHSESFGANPSSLYGEVLFGLGLVPVWTFGEQDAIIFLGCTPPPMRYFSYTPYVFTNPSTEREILFASLDDALNLMEINTTGSGKPFSHTTLVIMVADEITNARVKFAFARANLSRSAMNTLTVPPKLVTLGESALTSSLLSQLTRVAVYENETECLAYTNATWPVIRLQAPSSATKRPFQTPDKRKRGSGHSEVPAYNEYLDMLLTAVETNCTARGFQLSFKGQLQGHPLDGRECIHSKEDCLADCPDAAYMVLFHNFTFGPADSKAFILVVGVNHAHTGKAVYTNFALGSFEGVTDDKFGQSAHQYLPNEPAMSSFFAYKVARQCQGEEYCLPVPIDKVDPNKELGFVARAYLDPKTSTGPAYDELLMPYVLQFEPKP